ncbi:MAG: hypothetical protein DI570_07700 [Phenylobacterium zucineum]|nr:MAG: hypothetical protein DI570_07700 [Phenylobacterium zucineum]
MSTPADPKPARAAGGRKLMFISTVACQILALLRNIVVARILGPHEFGIAAVIILTIAFMDSLAAAGPQNLVIQAKDDDRRSLLGAAHSVTVIRGVGTSLMLLVLAAPISQVFGLELSWAAIVGLSVSSLLLGFVHHGTRMVQRDGDFRPDALTQFGAEAAALVVAVAAAFVTKSHMAIVIALVARSAVTVAMSQWLSPQKYEFNWTKSYLAQFWSFGWPLLINGPLLFFAAQADRLFISRELGVAVLGVYSAVTVLITSPSNAIMRWLGTSFTPALAKAFHDEGRLATKGVVYDFTALFVVSAFLMFAGFAAIGAEATNLLFGKDFATSAALVALVGLLQIMRYLRAWTSTFAIAVAASRGILISTLVRLASLPLGYVGLRVMGGLPGLLTGFIAGEVIALIVSQLIVNRNASRGMLEGVGVTVVFCGLSAGLIILLPLLDASLLLRILAGGVVGLGGAGLLLATISQRETALRARPLLARLRR